MSYLSKNEYLLRENDIIKFGRVRYKIKRIVLPEAISEPADN